MAKYLSHIPRLGESIDDEKQIVELRINGSVVKAHRKCFRPSQRRMLKAQVSIFLDWNMRKVPAPELFQQALVGIMTYMLWLSTEYFVSPE